MDERKSKRTRADSVHVSSAPDSPPRIYRRFYDGCRIPSIRYHVLPSSFTVSLNGKRREQKRATHVHGSRGEAGERENCISLARRGVAEHEKVGDERSSLSARRDYVVVETTLLVCGTGRKKLDRFYTRQCVY